MNFGSKFVYAGGSDDDDEDGDFFDGELDEHEPYGDSDSDDDDDVADGRGMAGVPVVLTDAVGRPKEEKKKKNGGGLMAGVRGLLSRDTTRPSSLPTRPKKQPAGSMPNVVNLSLGTLKSDAFMLAGEGVQCTKCTAYFSSISKLTDPPAAKATAVQTDTEDAMAFGAPPGTAVADDTTEKPGGDISEQLWVCEFCGTENVVIRAAAEVPEADTVDYLVEPGFETQDQESADQTRVIFVVDTSGSMGVTTPVPRGLHFRGRKQLEDQLKAYRREMRAALGADYEAYVPSGGELHVSRLQAVKAALEAQLDDMPPTRTVGLVTFSNDVEIVGDGVQEGRVESGDRLYDQPALLKAGSDFVLEASLRDSRAKLAGKIQVLQESGQTALGPAVVVALGLAGQKAGSQVVLCTDGLASHGVGRLAVDDQDEDAQDAAADFYKNLGAQAADRGVCISVISIEGSDCRLENVGQLADATGGKVDIVDPLNLGRDFAEALEGQVVATNVTIRVLLHNGLEFYDEENAEGSLLERVVGNVTPDTDISFEYRVTKEAQKQKNDKIPFQVQINYTKPHNGMKCVRVISKVQEVTKELKYAQQAADVDVLGVHMVQNQARLAHKGRYEDALRATRRTEAAVTSIGLNEAQGRTWDRYRETSAPMIRSMNTDMDEEAEWYGPDCDVNPMMMDAAVGGAPPQPGSVPPSRGPAPPRPVPRSMTEVAKMRARRRSDESAKNIIRGKGISLSKMMRK